MTAEAAPAAPRPLWQLILLACVAIALCALFVGLGIWQIERRDWKRDLIDRVERRIHAAPVSAPGPEQWAGISAADAYRHVQLTGRYRHDRETLVQAATALGAGHWVLTPLQTADGSIVLVNRGFVPPQQRNRATRVADEDDGEITVTGLLRVTEPGGAFLRDNDPAAERWTSRDVGAIANARGLADVAPYFIDRDADPSRAAGNSRGPIPGLTIVTFHNNHLVYAVTWFGLALMVIVASARVVRVESRLRALPARPGATTTRATCRAIGH